MKPFQDAQRSSELALSSDSDGESHDGSKLLLRKVSTQRQLKHGTCIKEGILHKQTSSSFQRWHPRYFKLRSRRLFYAKREDSEIFNEVDLTNSSVAERSTKNVNCSFSVIGPTYRLILCTESRKEMDEWISAIKAVQAGEFFSARQVYGDNFSDGHNWYACTHNRPTYCNVCRDILPGVMNHGLSCDVCKFKAHKRCAAKAGNDCKWATLAAVGKNVIEDEEGLWTPHQWLEGNLAVSAKCAVCEKTCGSVLRLQDWKCLWCRSVVHTACKAHMPNKCSIGPCRLSIVPPTVIHTQDADGYWQAVPSAQCTSPLLVFVNSKSGDNQGVKFLRRFRQFLNPAQVFDIMCSGPQIGLRMFRKFDTFRILICGGDGSVGWVLNEMDRMKLHKKAQVGVLPLGTGNDLAQVMGWGNVCDDDTQVPALIERYERACAKLFDRWSIMTYEGKPPINIQSPAEGFAMSEYEHTVADHLATILHSDKNTEVLSSSTVLCKTIKDFVTDVGKSYANEDTEMTQKCQVLDEKLSSLLNTLNHETKLAKEEQLQQEAVDNVQSRMTSSYASPLQVCPDNDITSEGCQPGKDERTHSNDDVPLECADNKKNQLKPDSTCDVSTATSKEGRLEKSRAVFVERSQLMLRANSLKKAVREIIEHTEKAIDEQNKSTKTSKVDIQIEEEMVGDVLTTDMLKSVETAPCALDSMNRLTVSLPDCRPASRSAPTSPMPSLGEPEFPTSPRHASVTSSHDPPRFNKSSFPSFSMSGPVLSDRLITRGSRYPSYNPYNNSRTIINPLYRDNPHGSFLSRMLLANADTLCAAVAPRLNFSDKMMDHLFTERCVMNNYFGIGLDAKISLAFHRKREEHPKKTSRTKNRVWYGVLATREIALNTYKNLEQRIRLECDGQPIRLPPLQGVVVLNIASFMGGTNFWGSRGANEIFLTPCYDDKLLEVVAVFSTVQLGMAIVAPDGVLQHHRIAQCRSVKITILGDEHVPLQTDGEAWLQPPGVIKIEHKNRVQMLARDRRLEVALKSWEGKQKYGSERPAVAEFLTENETLLIGEFAETIHAIAAGVVELNGDLSMMNEELTSLSSFLLRIDARLRPMGSIPEATSHQLVVEYVGAVRDLNFQLSYLLNAKPLELSNDKVDKVIGWLERIDAEMKKLRDIRWLPQFDQGQDEPPCSGDISSRPKSSTFSSGRFKLNFKRSQKKDSLRLSTFDDVKSWNAEDVACWLESQQLQDYRDIFVRNDVSGKELMKLDASDLKHLGITKLGHIKRLQAAIKDLCNQKSSNT